jgi:hypothetical protein
MKLNRDSSTILKTDEYVEIEASDFSETTPIKFKLGELPKKPIEMKIILESSHEEHGTHGGKN